MSIPEELFAQIGAWLSDLPGLEEEYQAFGLLAARRDGREFRVALVGGISRGKTRLLNSLLDTRLFPEGTIPTTTVLTEVAYGQEPEIIFAGHAGKTALPPDSTSLERFSSEGADADREGILQVRWPAPFLKQGLVLYDTPGIDDVLSQRANLAFSALEDAEGAVVVVSASVPVSLLERDFIQTYLENRAVPHIAVAVAFLDTLAAQDREHQIMFIQNRIRRIDPGIEVWLTGASVPGVETCGASAIRARLLAWANDPARQGLRDQRDLQFCAHLLSGCIGRLEEQLATLKADQAERLGRLYQASDNLEQQKEVWLGLRKDFLARSHDTAKAATAELEKLRRELTEAMRASPEATFHAELRQRLATSARSLTDLLRERLDRDTEELRKAVGHNFGSADLPGLTSTPSFAIAYTLPEKPEQNVGTILAALINYARGIWKNMAPMLPLPTILKGTAQHLVDRGLQSLAVLADLNFGNGLQPEQQIDAFFDGLRRQLGQSVTSLYEEKADHLREEQERWLAGQREMMAALRTPAQVEAKIATTAREIARGRQLLATVEACRKSVGK